MNYLDDSLLMEKLRAMSDNGKSRVKALLFGSGYHAYSKRSDQYDKT